jgi:hypothetical protein
LRNLPENRCPECGREFDPSDPNTFISPQQPASPAFVKPWQCILISVVSSFASTFLLVGFASMLGGLSFDARLAAFVSLLVMAGTFVISLILTMAFRQR